MSDNKLFGGLEPKKDLEKAVENVKEKAKHFKEKLSHEMHEKNKNKSKSARAEEESHEGHHFHDAHNHKGDKC